MKASLSARILVALALVALVAIPNVRRARRFIGRRMAKAPSDSSLVLVTGYCDCEKCCGWQRGWFGLGDPVYSYGPMKGKPKKVGISAIGRRTHWGTVAADLKKYKFGTRLRIPGYGLGVVEDVGGAIKGRHIDVWFPSHEEAAKWGAKWLKVVEVKDRGQK